MPIFEGQFIEASHISPETNLDLEWGSGKVRLDAEDVTGYTERVKLDTGEPVGVSVFTDTRHWLLRTSLEEVDKMNLIAEDAGKDEPEWCETWVGEARDVPLFIHAALDARGYTFLARMGEVLIYRRYLGTFIAKAFVHIGGDPTLEFWTLGLKMMEHTYKPTTSDEVLEAIRQGERFLENHS